MENNGHQWTTIHGATCIYAAIFLYFFNFQLFVFFLFFAITIMHLQALGDENKQSLDPTTIAIKVRPTYPTLYTCVKKLLLPA